MTESLPDEILTDDAAAQQLRALTRAQAIVHFDLSGRILEANQNFLDLFGYTLAEVRGRHHSMFVPSEEADGEEYVRFWTSLRRGEHQTATFKRVARDNHELWIQAAYIPSLDAFDRPVRIIKYAVDVTAERLNSAQDRGQIEAIERSQAIVEFDMRGYIMRANNAFLNIVGYTQDELVGAHHSKLVTEQERSSYEYERFWRDLRRGKHAAAMFERVAKDGSHRFVQASYSPILDMDGRPFKVVKYAHDVTAQKRMELELERSRQTAEQANEAKSRFLATVSHEIRSPMNGVLASAELLLQGVFDEQQRELCQIILSCSESLLALINDILDLSKLEADKLLLKPEPTDLRLLLQEIATSFHLQCNAKGIGFKVEVDPQVPPHLSIDALRLRQVLTNLCSNALKFTTEGSVTVRAEYAASEPDPLRLTVVDTGIGMADTSQLFEEYVQVDADHGRSAKGTGLGLAICRRLTKLMAGSIGVESTPGKGSAFTVTVAAPKVGAPPRAGSQAPHTRFDARVLVVDDNGVNRLVATRLLNALGIDVRTAGSGSDALRALSEREFDVVFMDCQMPVMDGYETTRQIRSSDKPFRTIPVVALTANAMVEDRALCMEAGMDAFLSKPVRSRDVQRALDELISDGRLRNCAVAAPPALLSAAAASLNSASPVR